MTKGKRNSDKMKSYVGSDKKSFELWEEDLEKKALKEEMNLDEQLINLGLSIDKKDCCTAFNYFARG